MKITGCEIHGLFGRSESISIAFHRDRHALFGTNGTGKTSILKILYSALSKDIDVLRRIPFASANVEFEITKSGKPVTYSRRIQKALDVHSPLGLAASGLSVLESSIGWHEFRAGEPHDHLPKSVTASKLEFLAVTRLNPMTATVTSGRTSSEMEAANDKIFEEHLSSVWLEIYHKILTSSYRQQYNGLQRILVSAIAGDSMTNSPSLSDEDCELVVRFMQGLHEETGEKNLSIQSIRSRAATDPLIGSILRSLASIQRNVEELNKPLQILEQSIQQLFGQSKQINLDLGTISISDHVSNPHEVKDLSSGEKHVLSILIRALRASNGVLIIDEPELSLHIDWQRRLIETVKAVSPSTQVIVASHSPEIVAQFETDQRDELMP